MTITGHIGSDARVNQVGERRVVNFSVAVNRRYPDKESGEMIEETTWVNCAKWENREGNVWKYLKKGTQVLVEGDPSFKIYRKQDNTPGTDISLRVTTLELLGSKKESSDQPDNSKPWNWNDEKQNGSTASSDEPQDEAFWSDQAKQEEEAAKMKAGESSDGAPKKMQTAADWVEGMEDPFADAVSTGLRNK